MGAVVRHQRVDGFDAVVLENARLRAVILPELGGRVWELRDLVRDRQWIWHRDGVPLAPAGAGRGYDDVWAGGWEELFPNDAPGRFEGRELPDHGEWWTLGWEVTADASTTAATVRLAANTRARATRCTKTFTLEGDGGQLQVAYRIESREPEAFHFLFKQHLAVAITPACRLALPGGTVTAVAPDFGTLLPGPGPFRWPLAGEVDLRNVPAAASRGREFLYVSDLPAPWCAVEDRTADASLRMDFDARKTPYLWLFLSYGGWRECYTAVLEPCTNLPKDLGDAVRAGQSARLEPGSAFETVMTVTLGSGEAAA